MTVARPVDRTVAVADVMGTVVSIDVRDPVPERDREDAAEAAIAALRQVDEQFSSFRPSSEVSRYANGALVEADLSHDLREVLRISSVLSDDSDGVFRRQRPESLALDVAGLVKGWAIDRAGETLRRHGMNQWCLTVGGDVLVSGKPGDVSGTVESGSRGGEPGPDGVSVGPGLGSGSSGHDSVRSGPRPSAVEEDGPWRVAVRDPFDSRNVRLVLPVVNRAVATSGSYERGAHVWDGRSGQRIVTAGSFTVIGPFMTYADAYATIGYIMGSNGLSWVARHPGYEALRVAPDGSLSATEGILLPATA